MGSVERCAIVGQGRAGTGFAAALRGCGIDVVGPLGRNDDLKDAASGVELVLLCVSDSAIAEVASRFATSHCVVAHVAGSVGLEVLPSTVRRAAIHPLVSIRAGSDGSELRGSAANFAVEGDDVVEGLVGQLGGSFRRIDPDTRAAYHAAACIASNHLVVLLAQVERIAEQAGLPLDAYLPLVDQTLRNVAELGPRRALTGPASRGDDKTLNLHRSVLSQRDRVLYDPLAADAQRLGTERSP